MKVKVEVKWSVKMGADSLGEDEWLCDADTLGDGVMMVVAVG